MNTLSQTDLHRLKWLLGQLLALIAFWAMLELDFGSQPLLLLMGCVVVATLVWPGLPARIPAIFWKAATPALVTIIILDFLLHGVDFLKPLVRMVMLLTLFRCLQYRARREDLQLVLLCLFILVITGVLTVSLTFGLQMMIFTPLAMAMLFVINLVEATYERKLVREDWLGFRWLSFLRRIRRSMDYRMLGFSGVLFFGVVAISSLIFVTIPRFNIDQALPFLQMPGTSTTGFSDTIRYGDVSNLQEDERVALRVEVPDAGLVPDNPYWRMVVLDEYTDDGFRMSVSLKRNNIEYKSGSHLAARYWGRFPTNPPESNEWIYYMEGNVSEYLPLPGPFDTLRFQKKSKYQPFPSLNLLALDAVSANVFGYSVKGVLIEDRLLATSAERLGLADMSPLVPPLNAEGRPELVGYPQTTRILPPNERDRAYLQSVVDEITGGEPLPAEVFVERASAWLRDNYRYNRRVRDLSNMQGDPLILWMQEDTQGWCEHFAGAFAMLSRTAGYPTRLVAGFAGADWNGLESYLIIRNSNAHAWVEMYDGKGYWLRVDPTPDVTAGGELGMLMGASSVGTISGWTAWMDSLRMIWYRRVINFDEGDQERIAEDLRGYSMRTYEETKAYVKAQLASLKLWLTKGWDREKALQLFLTIALVCFIFLAIRYLFLWGREFLLRKGSVLGLHATDPVRKQASRLLSRCKPVYEGTAGVDGAMTADWSEVYQALLALRYGESPDRKQARQVFRRARQLLRQSGR